MSSDGAPSEGKVDLRALRREIGPPKTKKGTVTDTEAARRERKRKVTEMSAPARPESGNDDGPAARTAPSVARDSKSSDKAQDAASAKRSEVEPAFSERERLRETPAQNARDDTIRRTASDPISGRQISEPLRNTPAQNFTLSTRDGTIRRTASDPISGRQISEPLRNTPAQKPTPSTTWSCSACTFCNKASSTVCDICGTPSPNTSVWSCPRCTCRNTGQRCSACNAPRPGSGRNAGGSGTSSTAAPPKPDFLYVSSNSQFTFGGESACAFGSLCIGEALLAGLDLFTPAKSPDQRDKLVSERETRIASLLSRASDAFRRYFTGRPRGHASATEILQGSLAEFSGLNLCKWASVPPELKAVASSLSFPEALLPAGEIQLQRSGATQLRDLLTGFRGSNVILCAVTIGYAFGVHCRADGGYTVYDSHRKSMGAVGDTRSGAYMAMFNKGADAAQRAARFIDTFTLDSRKAIIAAAQGMHQSYNAANMDVCAVSLANKSAQSKETKAGPASPVAGPSDAKSMTQGTDKPVDNAVVGEGSSFAPESGSAKSSAQSATATQSTTTSNEK